MSRKRPHLGVFCRLAATLVLVCCGASESAAPAPGPAAPPAKGTAAPPARPLTPEELKEKAVRDLDETRKARDETARGLLASFKSRTFDPVRDGHLDAGTATIDVKADGRDARYRATFAAGKPELEQVALETVSEPAGATGESTKELFGYVRRWSHLTFRGAYQYVAWYSPPIPLGFSPSADGKRMIVHVPPFRSALSVSYSFDERQVVETQGEWTSEADKAVIHYEWELWHGRYLLRKASPPSAEPGQDASLPVFHGPTIDFDYDDRDGLMLVRRVRLRRDERQIEAVFAYGDLKLRPQ